MVHVGCTLQLLSSAGLRGGMNDKDDGYFAAKTFPTTTSETAPDVTSVNQELKEDIDRVRVYWKK